MKSKPVVDKQLADDIEKLLKDNDVDEKVIVEVVGKINNNDDNVDADGEEVDLFDEEPEKVEEDKESEELDKNSELEDEDLDTEDESDEEDLEDESDDDIEEDEEEDDESDDESDDEVEDEDEEDLEEDEEVEDEGEAPADPLAKLDDPKFREGFDKGYQFALALLKNNILPEAEDSDEEVKEEEPEKIVTDEDKVEPVQPQPEMPTEKKAVGDSVEVLKEKLSAEINQLFKSRAKASEKVKPLVGSIRDVTVFDSAEAVYGFALKQNGVDIRKYKKDAYEGMVDVMLENLDKQAVNVVVGDAKDPDEFNDVISGAFNQLKKIES